MPPDSPSVRTAPPLLETDDGVYYPTCDNMGESGLQNSNARLLVELLDDYLRRHARPAVVGSNQFFYYRRGDPRAAVSPDLYVIDDETLTQRDIPSWKVWEHAGKAPTLALEFVSDEHKKDYADSFLHRYEQLGVRELLRFDPRPARAPDRKPLSHFVRDDHGRLVEQPEPRGRVRSVAYGVWFVQRTDNELRLATDPRGDTLWPTHAERAAAESQRAAAESRRAAAESRARLAAEARLAAAEARASALEAELARLRGE